MTMEPQKENLKEPNFKKDFSKKSLTRFERLSAFFSKANWISNLSLFFLLLALLAILFLRPEPAKLSDYLKVIAILTGLSATLISNTGLSQNAGTPDQQKADKKMALVLVGVTAFITVCSVVFASK